MNIDKYSKIRSQVIGFGLMAILGWYFYCQIDESNTFRSIGIFYLLFILSAITFLFISQSLYDKGYRSKNLSILSEIIMQFSLYSILFIPIIYINKIILNLCYIILPNKIENPTIDYVLLLAFLIVNRYLVKYYNILVFKIWDSNPYLLQKSNEVVNKSIVQQFIYFGIAILLFISQIDKGLYNVFSKEFNEIMVPASLTFIAIERALKSIGIE